MLKDTTYKDKFAILQRWMPSIVETIKRDLRNDHLRQDIAFVKRYFAGKNPAKLTPEELAPAYLDVMQNGEKSEELGEFITNRWLLKHTDLYNHFEEELSKITPDFSELTTIDREVAVKMMEKAVAEFGPIQTYLFCVFNSVVFPEEIYATLGKKADHYALSHKANEEKHEEHASMDALKRGCDQTIARLTDKYEKKLSGLQKKYNQDVDALKKQIATMQRKHPAS
ncbi:MAG: hypothetical protein WCF65_07325 [Parachlamydiaceae bacterium]